MYSASSIPNNQNLSGFDNIVNIRPGQNNRRTKNARNAKPVAPTVSQNTYVPKFKMVAVKGQANSPAQWMALTTNAGGAGGTVPRNFFNLYDKNYLNKTNAPKYISVNFPLPHRDVKRILRAFKQMDRILLEVLESLRSLFAKSMSPAERVLTTQYLLDVYKYVSKVRIQEMIWFTEIAKARPHAAELVNFPLTPMHAPDVPLRFKQNAGTVFASRQLQNLLNRIGDHYIRVTERSRTNIMAGKVVNVRMNASAKSNRTVKANARANVGGRIAPAPPVPFRGRATPRPIPAPSPQQSWFQRLKQLNARRLMPRMVSR